MGGCVFDVESTGVGVADQSDGDDDVATSGTVVM